MKRMLALLMMAPLSLSLLGGGVPSAPSYWEGADASGALPVAGSGVVLERENIRITIGSLPAVSSESPLQDYAATVETEYTLFNPGQEDAQMHFFLPCYRPEYMAETEAQPCEILLDGAPVSPAVRHCYTGYYERNPDLESGMQKIEGETDPFYCDESLAVHKTTYTVAAPSPREGEKFTLCVEFSCNPRKTRILSDRRMNARSSGGNLCVCFDVCGSDEVSLYAVGEDIAVKKETLFSGKEEVGGALSVAKSGCSYREFAMRDYPEDGAIAARDWFRGFSQMLSEGTGEGCLVFVAPVLKEENFMRWYEYGFSVPAGGRVRHIVRTAIYPDCAGGTYEYEYLLSPSFRFASFGELEIDIRTPYYYRHGTLDFAKDETGETHAYSLTRGSLPMCELSFSLAVTPEEEPVRGGLSPSVKLAIVVLSVVAGAGAAFAAGWILWRRHRKKGKEKEKKQ